MGPGCAHALQMHAAQLNIDFWVNQLVGMVHGTPPEDRVGTSLMQDVYLTDFLKNKGPQDVAPVIREQCMVLAFNCSSNCKGCKSRNAHRVQARCNVCTAACWLVDMGGRGGGSSWCRSGNKTAACIKVLYIVVARRHTHLHKSAAEVMQASEFV